MYSSHPARGFSSHTLHLAHVDCIIVTFSCLLQSTEHIGCYASGASQLCLFSLPVFTTGAYLPVICRPMMQHPAPEQLHHETTHCMDVHSTLPFPLPIHLLTALALLLHIMHTLLAGFSLPGGLRLAAVMPICRGCCKGVWDRIWSMAVEASVTETRGC